MQLTRIAGTCPDGRTCPAVYETDRGTVVVQRYALGGGELAQLALPGGEAAVEIPVALPEEVARAHRR